MAEDLINVSIHSDDVDDDYCMTLNSTVISNDPSQTNSLEQSMNRPGVVRVAKGANEAGVQTVPVVPDRPQIRVKAKVCTEQIKATCANVSAVCGISVELARLAVKTVCAKLYCHDYYLSPPGIIYDKNEGEPPSKQSRIPFSTADYAGYKYALPSARLISDYKQMQAS